MTAHLECHNGTLGHDFNPSIDQPSHLLYDHIILKLLRDLMDQIIDSDIVIQQVNPPLQWLDSPFDHSLENHDTVQVSRDPVMRS